MRRALLLWVLMLSGQACAGEVEPFEPPPASDTHAALEPVSTMIRAVDLLAGDLPSPLREAAQLQAAGETFDLDTMRELSVFGRAHTEDARPWLLLARDAVATGTPSFAVRYYAMAIEADAVAAFQPRVFEDLVEIVQTASGTELEEARELVELTYGLDEVSRQMDAALQTAREAREHAHCIVLPVITHRVQLD